MAISQSPGAVPKTTGGVLPVSIATRDNATIASQSSKIPAVQSRHKVVVRRLAPGLTQAEFEAALGADWKLGNGKVDWSLFRPGKVSKDLAKPSRPSRMYLHVTHTSHLDALAEAVRQTPFVDARSTSNDTVLLGPPVLEFAPYGRVPVGKRRNDPRQGLVDQDPEFIAFLESLTNPIVKSTGIEGSADVTDQKDAKVTVTPLIQHLREKKAAKEAAKEKASAMKVTKTARKADTIDAKADIDTPVASAATAKEPVKPSEKKLPQKGVNAERAAPKVVSKPSKPGNPPQQQQQSQAHTAPHSAPSHTETPKVVPATASAPQTKKTEPPNPGAAAARMLQRDLLLRGRGGGIRRGGRQAQDPKRDTVPSVTTTTTPQTNATTPVQAASRATTTNTSDTILINTSTPEKSPAVKPPTAPAIMRRTEPAKVASTNTAARKQPESVTSGAHEAQATTPAPNTLPPTPATTTASPLPLPPVATTRPIPPKQTINTPARTKPIPAPTSTHGFLKHANPSQGITEPLLNTAMQEFGPVKHVEIDKRKGFAYVEFENPEGLQKAMAASPIKIAQGNVQVLERKDRPAGLSAKPPISVAPAPAPAPAAAPTPLPVDVPGRGGGQIGGPSFARGGHNTGRGGAVAGMPPHAGYRGGRGGSVRGRGGLARGGNIAAAALHANVTTPIAVTTTPSTSIPATVEASIQPSPQENKESSVTPAAE